MAETENLDSFVKKLRSEGIEEGQREAEKIRKEAKEEADGILEDARSQADQIREDAEQDAQDRLARAKAELKVLTRDTIHQLRESLIGILGELLEQPIEQRLRDEDFLVSLLRDMVLEYAREDREESREIRLSLPDDLSEGFRDRLIGELQDKLKNDPPVDLSFALNKPGFKYTIDEGYVEFTKESIVEVLLEMASPQVREVLNEIAEKHRGKKGRRESEAPSEEDESEEKEDSGEKGNAEEEEDSGEDE